MMSKGKLSRFTSIYGDSSPRATTEQESFSEVSSTHPVSISTAPSEATNKSFEGQQKARPKV